MSFDLETLYNLLPAIYRIRDLEQSGDVLPISDLRSNVDKDKPKLPLQALLKVIVEQVAIFEENLAQLYDDQFIETCAEWVIPYIGDLVGARGIYTPPGSGLSQRAEVANTLRYRRRKGTVAVLEELAANVTRWPAHAVEFFQRLVTTQYM